MNRRSNKTRSKTTLPTLKQRKYPYQSLQKADQESKLQLIKLQQKEKQAANNTSLPIEPESHVKTLVDTTIDYIRNTSEQSSFDSFALYSECRLREAISVSTTTQMKRPNVLLTSTCTDLLLRLGNVMPQFKSLLNLLGIELSRSIYLDFDEKYFKPECPDTLSSYTPFFDVNQNQANELSKAKLKVRAFCGAGVSLGKLSEKRQNLMNSAIGTWQAMLVRRMFENWRMAVSVSKRRLELVFKRRNRLWFDTWKSKIKIHQINELRQSNQENLKEIAGLEEYVIELRDLTIKLRKENSELSSKLSDSSNLKLRQSNVEIDLRSSLQETERKMNIYKTMVEERMKEDQLHIVELANKKGKYQNRQLIHQIYPKQNQNNTDEEKQSTSNTTTTMDIWLQKVEEKIKAEKPNQIVMRWMNHHLSSSGINQIENFSTHLRDGEEWSAILTKCTQEEKQETKMETVEIVNDDNESVTESESEPITNITTTTHQDNVLEELDLNKRSTMNVQYMHSFHTPSSIIQPEEILQCNPDANFVMLSYLFMHTPNLISGQEQQDMQQKMQQFLHRSNAAYVTNKANNDEEDADQYFVRRCKQIYRMRQKMDRIEAQQIKSHALYNQAQSKISSFIIGELCGRLRGTQGSMSVIQERKEMAAYTSLSSAKIKDLIDDTNDEPAAEEESASPSSSSSNIITISKAAQIEINNLSQYLGNNFKDIKKIFRAYAAAGSGAASSISRGEFATLLKDIKIFDKSFTPAEADLIFLRSNWEIDETTGALKASADRSLSSIEFVEALVRCAHTRFLTAQTTTLKGCAEALFNRHLLPFAQRSDVDAFRKKISETRCQQVYEKYQMKLKMVFIEKAGNDGLIDLKEFTKFLKEKDVVNKQFPAKSVVKIFNCVQDEGEPVPEGGDDDDDDECPEDCEMTYSEFLEALAAVACFYQPDPYICLEQRLEVFFLTKILDHITPRMVRTFKQREAQKLARKKK